MGADAQNSRLIERFKNRSKSSLTWRQKVGARRDLVYFAFLHAVVFLVYCVVASNVKGWVVAPFVGMFYIIMLLMCLVFLNTAYHSALRAGGSHGVSRGLALSMRPIAYGLLVLTAGVGYWAGMYNYTHHMRDYFAFKYLRWYENVAPSMTFAEVADAKVLSFSSRSYIAADRGGALSFSGVKFCAAPIVDDTLVLEGAATSFWAVGLDCCVDGIVSGGAATFLCGNAATASGRTGIVLDDYELQNTYSTNLGRSDFDLYQAAIGKAVNRSDLQVNVATSKMVEYVHSAYDEQSKPYWSNVLYISVSSIGYFAVAFMILEFLAVQHRNARHSESYGLIM